MTTRTISEIEKWRKWATPFLAAAAVYLSNMNRQKADSANEMNADTNGQIKTMLVEHKQVLKMLLSHDAQIHVNSTDIAILQKQQRQNGLDQITTTTNTNTNNENSLAQISRYFLHSLVFPFSDSK